MGYIDEINVKATPESAGTDYDIRDKGLNAATTKTAMESSDKIVLKDNSGNYGIISKNDIKSSLGIDSLKEE